MLSKRLIHVTFLASLSAGTAACDDGHEADEPRLAAGTVLWADAKSADAKAAVPNSGAVDATPSMPADALLDRVKPILYALPAVAENPDNPITDAKITLGRMLYFEKRLSKNHDISCNTCHDLASYGVDVRDVDGKRPAVSLGHKGQAGDRNSPTVYNAAVHTSQFWDGRATDVEDQAKGPILNPVEMAMPDEKNVLATLQSIPGYDEAFKAAFPDEEAPITYDNLAKAIGAFERKLLTPTRYDKFLGGEMEALEPGELRGLQLFVEVGCTTCHVGEALGGTQFQKLGSVKPWPGLEDIGREKITASPADKFVFKVPSLRNITETAPYGHDGRIEKLEEIVQLMSEHQTAKGRLPDDQVAAIVAFLGALKGDLPSEYIAEPELPPSGPDTPGPDPS